jgi:hypothetical protein
MDLSGWLDADLDDADPDDVDGQEHEPADEPESDGGSALPDLPELVLEVGVVSRMLGLTGMPKVPEAGDRLRDLLKVDAAQGGSADQTRNDAPPARESRT